MAWQALPQQLAQLPCRLQHRKPQPRLHRRCRHQTQAAVLSTPVEEQAQRKSTLEALQSAVTITAAKTPYLENGKIDLREYDRLVERQIEGGVEGVIVGGTTGEGQVGPSSLLCSLYSSRISGSGAQSAVLLAAPLMQIIPV